MKKLYETPRMDILLLPSEDVIFTSNGDGYADDDYNDEWNWE